MGGDTGARLVRHAGCARAEMKRTGSRKLEDVTKHRTQARHSSPRSQESKAVQWAFISLGANLGDPKRTILEAINCLREYSDKPVLRSSIWQTPPVDCPPGSPPFLNAVIAIVPRSGETPQSLLAKLHELEKSFGRKQKKILNEARPLDLDLIAFGNETSSTMELRLPHPRAHLRRFVLEPLSEIAPNLLLVGQSKTVSQLLDSLPREQGMRKLCRAS